MTSTSAPLQRLEGVPAPAKLNLFLHIVGPAADGYHLLQSVFMLIDWMPTLLDFERHAGGQITREDWAITRAPAPQDLVRARRAGLAGGHRMHPGAPTSAWTNATCVGESPSW
jgi:4-diphosphocytidyl-2-C-methyl-D-erythritol kinase